MLISILDKIKKVVVPRLDSARRLFDRCQPARTTGPHPTYLCSPSKVIQFIGLLQIGMRRQWHSYLDTRKNSGDLAEQANSGCGVICTWRHICMSSLPSYNTKRRCCVGYTSCIFMPRWWTDYAWPARASTVTRVNCTSTKAEKKSDSIHILKKHKFAIAYTYI